MMLKISLNARGGARGREVEREGERRERGRGERGEEREKRGEERRGEKIF